MAARFFGVFCPQSCAPACCLPPGGWGGYLTLFPQGGGTQQPFPPLPVAFWGEQGTPALLRKPYGSSGFNPHSFPTVWAPSPPFWRYVGEVSAHPGPAQPPLRRGLPPQPQQQRSGRLFADRHPKSHFPPSLPTPDCPTAARRPTRALPHGRPRSVPRTKLPAGTGATDPAAAATQLPRAAV